MQYYFAPMEGLTDRIYRNAHHRFFGGAGDADRNNAPFLSPNQSHTPDEKKLRDVLPENNPGGVPLVPQILTNSAADFLWLAGVLGALGYGEVNLNLGCPSGTVAAKGKGAGMLRDPARLDEFLYEIYAGAVGKISVKTRLGVAQPEEFGRILEIYNKYPLAELTIHPRVQKQFYRGDVDRAAFEAALRESRAPVCYNGSLYTVTAVNAFAAAHPQISAVMLGRGVIADPALFRRLRGGAPLDKETLAAFMDTLYREYSVEFGSPRSAINRMKGLWHYVIERFDEHERLEKQLKKAREGWEYETTVRQIFAQLPLREEPLRIV